MNRTGLIGVSLFALCAGSSAMAAANDWTGFYVNGGLGYGSWSADTTTTSPTTGACILCSVQTQGGSGSVVKLGVGYDHQFSNNTVVGALLDYDFTSLKGTIQDQGPFFAGTIKQKSAWAAGARVGWLFTPDTLTYLNAGYSNTHFSGTSMVNTFQGQSTTFSTDAFNKGGWFVGMGMETRLSSNWFLRGEYRYAGYRTTNIADKSSTGTVAANITFKPAVQTATLQAVYRF